MPGPLRARHLASSTRAGHVLVKPHPLPLAKIINDLDVKNKWREYQEDGLTTDALWISKPQKNDGKFIIPHRAGFPGNDPDFHGLFIPEIPYQFIRRFTKKGDTVFDPFAGSGTTHRIATYLERKCISTDLDPKHDFIGQADARFVDAGEPVQLVILHPPYHNIVTYSDGNHACGSQQRTIHDFKLWFAEVVRNVDRFLEPGRMMILVCGNIYADGEELTLGVWLKDIVCGFGYKCKSQIIKDYGETKGKDVKNYNINYTRQLRGHYNNFYGDNIFILQKKGK